ERSAGVLESAIDGQDSPSVAGDQPKARPFDGRIASAVASAKDVCVLVQTGDFVGTRMLPKKVPTRLGMREADATTNVRSQLVDFHFACRPGADGKLGKGDACSTSMAGSGIGT